MKQVCFFHKATLVPHRTGVWVFPAQNDFIKPVVMAARLLLKYKGAEHLRQPLTQQMANRFPLYDVALHNTDDGKVYITAQILEDGRDPVFFDETYDTALILGEPE